MKLVTRGMVAKWATHMVSLSLLRLVPYKIHSLTCNPNFSAFFMATDTKSLRMTPEWRLYQVSNNFSCFSIFYTFDSVLFSRPANFADLTSFLLKTRVTVFEIFRYWLFDVILSVPLFPGAPPPHFVNLFFYDKRLQYLTLFDLKVQKNVFNTDLDLDLSLSLMKITNTSLV